MNRLTKRAESGDALFVHGTCFCPNEVCERLAAYEDTGLEPEEVRGMDLSYRELRDCLQETGIDAGLDRLRDLAQADKEGRVVVLPQVDKSAADEALRKAMYTVGITNNAVNRYIADAVAEKLVRDEAALERRKGEGNG